MSFISENRLAFCFGAVLSLVTWPEACQPKSEATPDAETGGSGGSVLAEAGAGGTTAAGGQASLGGEAGAASVAGAGVDGGAAGVGAEGGAAGADSGFSGPRPMLVRGECVIDEPCLPASPEGFPALSADGKTVIVAYFSNTLGPQQDLWLQLIDVASGVPADPVQLFTPEEAWPSDQDTIDVVAERVAATQLELDAGHFHSLPTLADAGMVAGFESLPGDIGVKPCTAENYFEPDCASADLLTSVAFDPTGFEDEYCHTTSDASQVYGNIDTEARVVVLNPIPFHEDFCGASEFFLVKAY